MSATVYPCPECGANIMAEPCEECGYPRRFAREADLPEPWDAARNDDDYTTMTPREKWEADEQHREDVRAYWDFVGMFIDKEDEI